MIDRLILYNLFMLAFATFGAVFLLVMQGVDYIVTDMMTLVPLIFWVIFYWMRIRVAGKLRTSPFQIPEQAEKITIYGLCFLAILTLGAIVYLSSSSTFNFRLTIYPVLFAPLGLSLFFYLGRSLLTRHSVEMATTVSQIVPSGSLSPAPEVLIPSGPVVIERIVIENFRNFAKLEISLTESSSLSGNWTCIAGINGAGKTSILQAICLVLLGEKLATELGGERLKRMLRQDGTSVHSTTLTATCRIGGGKYDLALPISENGIDEIPLRENPNYWLMRAVWSSLQGQMVVSYGATRNLSDRKETRNASLSAAVQRQMTLFDPLTQIASIDVLLSGGQGLNARIIETLEPLLAAILGKSELGLAKRDAGNRLRFNRRGALLEALDLPDGYRSTVAWLADLCAAWHETAPPGVRRSVKPEEITGIVLVDEIDLHLHFRLQREIIPRMRKALPKVQFIVTTHSPMILASFDRGELIVLDEDTDDGQRTLDRQLFGLTVDEIVEYLMGTKPQSPVITELLETDSSRAAELLYQGVNQSETDAKEALERRQRMLQRIHAGRAEPGQREPE